MTKMFNLDDILNNRGMQPLDTIRVAGRDISIAQKPHVEADVGRAHTVLTRLLAISEGSVVTTVRSVVTEIEVD